MCVHIFFQFKEFLHWILVAIIHESYNLLYSLVNKIKKSNQTMHFEHTYIRWIGSELRGGTALGYIRP